MNKSVEILNELQSISPFLASIEKINVFNVPDGYFNTLAERITTYTFLNKNEELNFSKNETLKVPEGYFDALSDQILAKIKSRETEADREKLEQLSPLLYSLKGKNVFTVPEGYFENVPNEIIGKINRTPAKVVSISKSRTWWKYAAAAVLTGAIVVSSLQIFNSSPDVQKNNSIVNESSGLPDYIKSSFQYKTPEQVDKGIASLSDNVIVQYLENHGNILDEDALTSDIDEKELPATTDYLSDKNTLNNYLSTIDAQNSDTKTP